MARELYLKYTKEFKETVQRLGRMPKVWECKFSDRTDQRIWFNDISCFSNFDGFVEEIREILAKFNQTLLTNKEKEEQFLDKVAIIRRIPLKGEFYFTDYDEMRQWYMSYKITHKEFETIVHNSLVEFKNFEITEIWPHVKKEFEFIIKKFKRIPNHGEAITQDGIDIRTIYDKLERFDPKYVERVLLHLQTYNNNGLSIDDRVEQLLNKVSQIGYIPSLQECRFSDGTDMFTWYTRYKKKLPDLEEKVKSRIKKDEPVTNVNIYLIPNFKETGGKFYTICTNVGERLDLSGIKTFEEAKKLDNSLVKRGGLILKRNEEIGSINDVKGKSKK